MKDDNVMPDELIEDSGITTVIEEAVLSEKPKKKKKEVTNKIRCTVNYNIPRKNKTSISYSNGDSNCSVFIDGIYTGTLEIEYIGEKFLSKNIKNINVL